VEENLRLFSTIYGMTSKEIREASDSLFKELEMENLRKKYVNDIPVGWKQKLAFATATIHQPEIVFLDEPTGGVDPVTRRKFWELIYKASADGMTVFVTTHYLDEAEYCNRVSIMVDGKISAMDSPAALKEKYHAATMDEVFRIVAKDAKREE
ncbi:MAG: ABC transporter ATP-binding protein, partial [Paramuribaculum sp.]|nr:ABC transporter ATP-binding protein [Paramuribaculum sp.]